MKALKSLFLLAAFFLILPSGYSQQANPNAPQMTFNTTVHNFGNIKIGGNGTCEFPFRNDGKEPLILIKVQSSCGCTIPEYPKRPILPAQSDVIKVKYDTQRQGPFSKTITIITNAMSSPIVLKISGTVVPLPILPEK